MPAPFRSTTADLLPAALTEAIVASHPARPVRGAVDGPACAGPQRLANAMAGHLRRAGREAVVIPADTYWRDASVRLEYGRTDVDSYYDGWLDRSALTREVLQPLGPGGDRRYLPGLRDPGTNRSLRAGYVRAATDAVAMIAGDLLLGRELAFDFTVHLAVSASARRRRTPPEWAWTLAAFERYDRETDPGAIADIVVSWTDPARPAVRARPRPG